MTWHIAPLISTLVARLIVTVYREREQSSGIKNVKTRSGPRELLEYQRTPAGYITGTLLDGRFVIRVCVLSFRTHMDRMRMCIEDIEAAVRELLGRAGPTGDAPGGRQPLP